MTVDEVIAAAKSVGARRIVVIEGPNSLTIMVRNKFRKPLFDALKRGMPVRAALCTFHLPWWRCWFKPVQVWLMGVRRK